MSHDMKVSMKEIKTIDGVDITLNAMLKHTKKLSLTPEQFYLLSSKFIRIDASNLPIIEDLLVKNNKICDVVKKYRKSKQTIYALNRAACKKHLLTQVPKDWVCVSVLLPQEDANQIIAHSTKALNSYLESALN